MKKTLLLLSVVSFNSFAYVDDPQEKFNATANMSNKMTITWQQVDDVNASCEKESRKRGNGGFGYSMKACAFWDRPTNTCTIITAKTTTQAILGHEARHCFQGDFHKQPK